MKDIKLVDCTLRDGGYVNDWEFGNSTMLCIFERLVQAGIDIIEIGFLDERRSFDPDRSIQPDTGCYDRIYAGCEKGSSLVVAMIDYGTCSIERIGPCEESFIDGIRVIFKKPKMRQAVEFARQVKAKGYKVFLQLVSITAYQDRDILDLVDLLNELEPYAVSMVDTYGLMHKEDMFAYFHLLNRNLKESIILGYHSHNNFQLGYANEIELLRQSVSRVLMVDGTVYGMGKSAGNAPLELLVQYVNENYGGSYDIDQILEIIDVNIMRIYKEHYWGYSLLFFLSAANDCHPNYIHYLLDKGTLSVKAINDIAREIEKPKKLDYDKSYIEQLYRSYQQKTVFESETLSGLRRELGGRPILLLGPGKSLATREAEIRDYTLRTAPTVIAVNCVPDRIPADYVFISNSKRYSMLYQFFRRLEGRCRIIATSNISDIDRPFDYVFSYEALLDEDPVIEDNALIMLLKALKSCGVGKATLAGFDGFSPRKEENYYDEYMQNSADYDRLQAVNEAVKAKLKALGGEIAVEFLTPSLYES